MKFIDNLVNKIGCKLGMHDLWPVDVASFSSMKVQCKCCKKFFLYKAEGEHKGAYIEWDDEVEEFYQSHRNLVKPDKNDLS